MRLRTTIEYSDPGEQPVTITLRGPLKAFESMADQIRASSVPYYSVSALLDQISTAAYQLRGRTQVDLPQPPARVMVEGDIYS